MPLDEMEVSDISFTRENDPPSVGMHRLKIVSIAQAMGGSGFPYLLVRYAVVGTAEEGRQVQDRVSLSPQARFRVDQWLDAVGAPKSGGGSPKQFEGRIVRAEIVHEEYEGVMRGRPSRYLPDGAVGPQGGSGVASPDTAAPSMPLAPAAPVPRPKVGVAAAART